MNSGACTDALKTGAIDVSCAGRRRTAQAVAFGPAYIFLKVHTRDGNLRIEALSGRRRKCALSALPATIRSAAQPRKTVHRWSIRLPKQSSG